MERRVPTKEEVLAYLKEDRNWGRWGADDQMGAVNMVTPEKRLSAAGAIRSGRAVSLSREFPKTPAPNNPSPALHYMKRVERDQDCGYSADFYGISYHGTCTTHLDALCHVWNEDGMWNGRNPDQAVTMDGAIWGAVDHWKEGIITRGVLLDVPKYRNQPYVTFDDPVHGWELEDIAKERRVCDLGAGRRFGGVQRPRKMGRGRAIISWGSEPRLPARTPCVVPEVPAGIRVLPVGVGHGWT